MGQQTPITDLRSPELDDIMPHPDGDSDDGEIVVATRPTAKPKLQIAAEFAHAHLPYHQGTARNRTRPSLIVKLKFDPRELSITSIDGVDGMATQAATTNNTVLGSQDKLEKAVHNMKTGMEGIQQLIQAAETERDVARNRSIGLRTELDMARERIAWLEQKCREARQLLRQAQKDALQRDGLLSKVAELEKQLQQAEQQAAQAKREAKIHFNDRQYANQRANAAKQAATIAKQELRKEREYSKTTMEQLAIETTVTSRMKEVIQKLAAECPWQTEKSGAPGGKLLDELLKLANRDTTSTAV